MGPYYRTWKGAGGMAWDWGPIALAMDQSSVSKYPGQAAHNYLQLQGSDTLFWTLQAPHSYPHTHTQTLTYRHT